MYLVERPIRGAGLDIQYTADEQQEVWRQLERVTAGGRIDTTEFGCFQPLPTLEADETDFYFPTSDGFWLHVLGKPLSILVMLGSCFFFVFLASTSHAEYALLLLLVLPLLLVSMWNVSGNLFPTFSLLRVSPIALRIFHFQWVCWCVRVRTRAVTVSPLSSVASLHLHYSHTETPFRQEPIDHYNARLWVRLPGVAGNSFTGVHLYKTAHEDCTWKVREVGEEVAMERCSALASLIERKRGFKCHECKTRRGRVTGRPAVAGEFLPRDPSDARAEESSSKARKGAQKKGGGLGEVLKDDEVREKEEEEAVAPATVAEVPL